MFIKKTEGTSRFCFDFERFDEVTTKYVYKLPQIDYALSKLEGAILFSVIDLQSGYWKVPLAEVDKPKAVFATPYVLYPFLVISFGLFSAPSTFHWLMGKVLEGISRP